MHITKTQNGDKTVLGLSGRLDTVSSPEVQEALTVALDTAKEVVLDFSELAYISSAGLRVLLIGEKTARQKSCTLSLTGVSQDIREVLEMTGFDTILQIT